MTALGPDRPLVAEPTPRRRRAAAARLRRRPVARPLRAARGPALQDLADAPGEWFEGCYVFVDDAARAAFQEQFSEDAAESPGSQIIGSAPVLIEECEVVAVAGGPEGFVSVPSYDG